ncbi:serine/threonine protein phosphatase [Mycolicibacterium sp. P1-18]|uniref:PP2C family protein-serine/threonine phosphatase n=1 Tax=Mycolicibacterium sp. P1-18 TaxID=2024615 RepID=UPI0011F25B02|nr:SpoIIE family protein phosphatase [Mycolicibacterium sp. P1-18]KAA0090922.1 serine/threonine protein phosphatase [Mycolicibacterium sp. P1-18]
MAVDQTVSYQSTDPAAELRVGDQLIEDVRTALSGSLNLRRTALRLLTMIRPRLADWGMVVLPGDRPGSLTLVGGDDAGFHAVISTAAIADHELSRLLRTGGTELRHVMMDADAEVDLGGMIPHPRLAAEAATMRPADLLAVGLTARGATIGALVMIRSEGRGFDARDVTVAERVATSAALALDSARLYEERGRIASVLQSSLRPPTLPDVDGARLAARYRPAAEHLDVGGDFYDVHGRGDDWLLTIGDVSGKGVEAAALTGRTRQSIRTACHFDRRPEIVLGALNTVLFDEHTKDFVTVVCARMRRDADGRFVVDVAAAGHPPPIVLRRDGRVETVGVSGTAVGMVARVEYRPATVALESGDTMLMFTDGVDEATGPDGMYGVDRLLALLPRYAGADPEVLCEAIEQDVLEYLDGRQHDDIALLAVTCGD